MTNEEKAQTMADVARAWNQIEAARLLTLRQMLKLEMKGMHRRGRSAYAILKSEYGFKGTRERVLSELDEIRNQLIGESK